MSYNDDYCEESENEPHTIPSILASIVFFVCLLWIAFSTPDDFRAGGMFFDKYPSWMDLVYVLGIIAASAFIAFIAFFVSVLIIDRTGLRKKIREPKVKRTYKF